MQDAVVLSACIRDSSVNIYLQFSAAAIYRFQIVSNGRKRFHIKSLSGLRAKYAYAEVK
jgi:hypothetical protein